MCCYGGESLLQANINIKVTEDVKDALDRLKLHRREPYHEVIAKLIVTFVIMQELKEKYTKEVKTEVDVDPAEHLDLFKELYKRLWLMWLACGYNEKWLLRIHCTYKFRTKIR